jgi:hypothetical protein
MFVLKSDVLNGNTEAIVLPPQRPMGMFIETSNNATAPRKEGIGIFEA